MSQLLLARSCCCCLSSGTIDGLTTTTDVLCCRFGCCVLACAAAMHVSPFVHTRNQVMLHDIRPAGRLVGWLVTWWVVDGHNSTASIADGRSRIGRGGGGVAADEFQDVISFLDTVRRQADRL